MMVNFDVPCHKGGLTVSPSIPCGYYEEVPSYNAVPAPPTFLLVALGVAVLLAKKRGGF